jgi:hypothetical protein
MAVALPGTFGELVTLLLSLGPKVRKVWPQLLLIYNTIVAVVGEFKPPDGEAIAFSAEDEANIAKLQSLLVAEGEVTAQAFGDGKILKGLWGFAKSNPQLMQLLISLIAGAAV